MVSGLEVVPCVQLSVASRYQGVIKAVQAPKPAWNCEKWTELNSQ